jgi:transcriptional regulator with XRE-family HTH domain
MIKSAKSIGDLIYYYRLVKNFSQQELADKLHVTVSAVSSWERGINKPGVDIAVILADDMGVSLDEFYRLKPKISLEKPLTINQKVSFEKAYFKIKHIEYDPESSVLVIAFQIWGVSISKESVEKNVEIQFSTPQKKVKIISKVISTIETGPSMISPEFQQLPSLAKRYELSYQISYHPYEDLALKVNFQDEEADYFIPGLLLRTVIRGPIFDAKDPNLTLDFLKTEIFRCALEYFSQQDDFKALQAYLVFQYEILMKHIKST